MGVNVEMGVNVKWVQERAPLFQKHHRGGRLGWLRRLGARPDLWVALLVLGVGTVRSGVPSYWTDEAATIMSARRPWWSLMAMAQNVDAVHTVYYSIMHVWIDLVGVSPIAVRFSSALAVAATAAAVCALARRMGWTWWWQAAAGVSCGLLPRLFYSAANARSAALETLCAVLLLLCAMRAASATRCRVGWWALYCTVLVCGVGIFLFTALLVPVAALAILAAGHRRWRPYVELAGWSALAALFVSPLLVLSQHQKGQVEFLGGRDVFGAHQIIDVQWFHSAPYSWIGWGLIVVAILAPAIRSLMRRPRCGDVWTGMLVAWMLFPMLVLWVTSRVYTPVFTQRYVSNCSPAVALLIVLGIREFRVPVRWARGHLCWRKTGTVLLRGGVVALALLLLLPNLVQLRQPTEMHRRTDWNRVAAVIGAKKRSGDAILYDNSVRRSWSPRNISHVYPHDFSGLRDVSLKTPYWKTGGLWDVSRPESCIPARVRGSARVWAVQVAARRGEAALQYLLAALGYVPRTTWHFSLDTVTLWERSLSTSRRASQG